MTLCDCVVVKNHIDVVIAKLDHMLQRLIAHFITNDWELVSCVLETTHFAGSHTGVNISEQLKHAVERFDVDSSKVVAIIHDQATNVQLACRILWEELE